MMTTVTIELPDAVEKKLRARAAKQGKDVVSLALEILEKSLQEHTTSPGQDGLAFEEWSQKFDAWVRSHPQIDVVLDDGRESIYEGRVE